MIIVQSYVVYFLSSYLALQIPNLSVTPHFKYTRVHIGKILQYLHACNQPCIQVPQPRYKAPNGIIICTKCNDIVWFLHEISGIYMCGTCMN